MANKLKRKSHIGVSPSLNGSVLDGSFIVPDETDENDERRERQKLRNKRVSIVPNIEDEDFITSSPSGPVKSAAELSEHYTNCIKLSAENKINVKNAFKLKLIDCMSDLVRKKEMDNFQAASCALDASTKIYAYRVDSVHTATLKLAGGVGSDLKDDKNNFQEKNNDEDDDNRGDNIQPPIKKKRNRDVIEKNLKNIDVNKFDLEFDVDPLFKKTTAQYDSGGVGGGQYFMNTLRIRDDSVELMWNSDDILPPFSFKTSEEVSRLREERVDESCVIPKLSGESSICRAIDSFTFGGWSLEDDDLNGSIVFSQPSISSTQKHEEHVFDVNAPVPVLDEPEDCGVSIFDAVDEGGIEEDDLVQDSIVPFKTNSAKLADKLLEHLSTVPLEYSYFDKRRLQTWIGPRHWKFKQPVVRPIDKKISKKREDGPIIFDNISEFEDTMVEPSKPTTLQKRTIIEWPEDKKTLPENLKYTFKDLLKLNTLDILPVKSSEKNQTLDGSIVDQDVGDYDFDNINDADNFCPDIPTADYEDNSGLVEAPTRVEKINIGYAKQAKKMDMKKLKVIQWEVLTLNEEPDKENRELPEPLSVSMNDRKSFSNVYKQMEKSKKLPLKMSENLSVPLAFVSLLHLCNEKSLTLEGLPDLSDFIISQN